MPSGCSRVDPIQQICESCKSGFKLDPLLLVCAPLCPSGQTPIGSDCYRLPPDCTSLNIFLHCSSCAPNKRLSGGQCVPCDGPNPNFPCVTCPFGQSVNNNGLCIRVNDNCDSIDMNNGWCLTCASGDIPVDGLCCLSGQSVQNGVCVGSGQTFGDISGPSGIVFRRPDLVHCRVTENGVCAECLNGRAFNSQGLCQ